MKTKNNFNKQITLSLMALMIGCFSINAQITTQPDKGYTFKNNCIDFYPSSNDTLTNPTAYKAFVAAGALHGTFVIDSVMPFKATYCPFANYLGKDTMFYKICNSNFSVCGISSIIINIDNQSISNVWPGDFNHDGETNSFDLLFLANSLNSRGAVGFNRTPAWAPSFCDDWNSNTWGVNNKYIDADGNGIIEPADMTILLANLNQSRSSFFNNNNYVPYKNNVYMPFYTKVRKTNLVKGDTIEVDVFFGDTSGLNEAQKIVTGAACLITIDSSLAVQLKNSAAWFESANNWIIQGLGTNAFQLVSRKTDRLAFDIGFSRIDHVFNQTNYTAGCNQLSLSMTTKDKTSSNNLAEIYTSVSGGAAPYNYFWSNGSSGPNINGLSISGPSTNSLTVVDANNCTVSGHVTVMDKSGNGRGMIGTLKVIVDDDIYQVTNTQNKSINFIAKNPYLIDNLIPEFINVIKYQTSYGKPVSEIQSLKELGQYQLKKQGDGRYVLQWEEGEQIDKVYVTDITGRELHNVALSANHQVVVDVSQASGELFMVIVNTDKHFYSIKIAK
jgi:hypothetical protein